MADKTLNLLTLIKRINLGGIVEEAIIDFDNASCQAVDVTNSLFLKVGNSEETNDGIGVVGIGNLALLSKYIDTFKNSEIKIKKKDNRIIFSSKDHGQLSYLSTDIDFISTAVKEDDISLLLEPCVIKLELSKEVCSDISTYFSLVKSKSAIISVDVKKESILLEGGEKTDHQFSINVGKFSFVGKKKASMGSFSVKIYSEHFNAVVSVLEWTKEETPTILMAPEHPLIFKQNKENIWALLPIGNTEEE